MNLSKNLTIALAAMGIAFAASGEARADAIGCDNRQIELAPNPNAIFVDIKPPFGYLCHSVDARGKEVKKQKAAFTTNAGINEPLVTEVCNWRIDFVYYNENGDEVLRDEGETISDCKEGATRSILRAKTLKEFGSTCAKLIIDGELRYSQCSAID